MEDSIRTIVAGASAGGFPAIAQVIGGLSQPSECRDLYCGAHIAQIKRPLNYSP